MTSIVTSIVGHEVGLDGNKYLTTTTGIKTPSLYIGASGSEVQITKNVPMQLVGTRTGLNGGGGALSGAGNACRIQHCLPFGATNLSFVYAGFYMNTSNPVKEIPMSPGQGYKAISVALTGGTSYAVGDTVQFTVITGAFSPTVSIDAVSGGVPTAWSVIEGGLFAAIPSTGLTQASTSGTGTGVTATFTCQAFAYGFQLGIEQSWSVQTAFSTTALNGVLKVTSGATNQGANGNLFMPMGDLMTHDPLQGNWTAGTLIGSRFQTPGNLLQTGRVLSGSAGLNEDSHASETVAVDPPWGGTWSTHASPASGHQPLMILGKPTKPTPSFIFVGDSIGYGTYSIPSGSTSSGAFDASANSGWLEQAVAQQFPWSNFCTASDRLANWLVQPTLTTGSALRMKAIAMANPSHIVDEMGINDVSGGAATFATLQANKIQFWSMLLNLGVKEIWVPTLTPNPTSTTGLSAIPTIAAGGTGYAVSSTFNVTLAGGTGTAAIVNVTTNSSGVVTTINGIMNIGYYTANPATTNSPTGGIGSGLSLTCTFAKCLDLVSQSTSSANTAIQLWNSWLRGGNAAAYGVTTVLDLGTDVESSIGSGFWFPGNSLDAFHPTAATHTLIAGHQSATFAGAHL